VPIVTDAFELLRAMPSLEDVPDDAVKWLASSVDEVRFAAGAQIIAEGELDRDCYFIVEGLTDVVMAGRVVGQTPAGEPEGEMALFFSRPRGCTTTAVTDLITFLLRAGDYDELVATAPDTAAALRDGVMAHMSRRFAK
jgi:CRP-like cAMP-binding protein